MRIIQLFPKLYLYLITNSTLCRVLLTKFNRPYKHCSKAKPLGLVLFTTDFLKSLLSPYLFLCLIFSITLYLLVSSLTYGNWQMLHQFIKKKDDPSDVSNYRHISLLSTIGKILEKIVHKYVFNFFLDNEVITTLQSGFIPGDSTVNQLVDVNNTFCKALDEGKEIRAIFCDISKAFDRVWHRGLLFKLQSVGISGLLLQWFTDYLHKRKQRVVLPGANSD